MTDKLNESDTLNKLRFNVYISTNEPDEMFGFSRTGFDPAPDFDFTNYARDVLGVDAVNSFVEQHGSIIGMRGLWWQFARFINEMDIGADGELLEIWSAADDTYSAVYGNATISLRRPPFSILGLFSSKQLRDLKIVGTSDEDLLYELMLDKPYTDKELCERARRALGSRSRWGRFDLIGYSIQ